MEITIGILTVGLVLMALLVVEQTRYVLRHNQRPPDQAVLVSMVQDLVNVVLTAKRPELRWQYKAGSPLDEDNEPITEPAEDTADPAMQVARM